MFETSGTLTTCLAIYPNATDTWNVSSPFSGHTLTTEDGFVFSNSTVNNSNLYLIQSRLSDLGKVSNEVNFIEKTNLKQSDEFESKGIGGISKLKDFKFKLTKGSMTESNIISLYGRKVILFYTETTRIEDHDSANSSVEFVGRIYNSIRSNNEIEFIVRGLLNSDRPTISGEVVTASDGSKKTEPLVFGNTGDLFVPLVKKKEDGVYKLQFSQSDDFIIKDLYVKGGSQDEPLFNKIATDYTITNDEILFSENKYSNCYLLSNVDTTNHSFHLDRIAVVASWEIWFTFHQTFTPPAAGTAIQIGIDYPGGSPSREVLDNRITYVRTDYIEDQVAYVFNCGWELAFGYFGAGIDDNKYIGGVGITYGGQTGGYAIMNSPTDGWINFKMRFLGKEENPVEKEIDALPWSNDYPGSSDYSNWNGEELKEYIQKYDVSSYKKFQLIPSTGLIMKVNDEEMLIVYTEKDSANPTTESLSLPTNTYVWVLRGWNNTTIANHSANDPVIILDKNEQSVTYTMERVLQSLTTISPSYDWSVTNINDFLSGSSDLVVYNIAGNNAPIEHDFTFYMGLDFKLPDLSGELIDIKLIGEAYSTYVDTSDLGGSADWRRCSINLALNGVDKVEHPYGTGWGSLGNHQYRRKFGYNEGAVNVPWTLSNYSWVNGAFSSDFNMQGRYTFMLKKSWGCSVGTHVVWSEVLNETTILPLDLYNISSYDDLRDETSIFICFNSSNIENLKTHFKLTLPTMHIRMNVKLEDADIYAQVIPKSIFNNPKDTFAIGTNCKICWHIKDQNDKYDKKDTIMVSDDSSRYFGALPLDGSHDFGTFTQTPSGVTASGFLSDNLGKPNTIGKMYPSQLKYEYFENPGSLPAFPNTLSSDWSTVYNKYSIGRTFLENELIYVWVDQANNLIKSINKADVNIGNPVTLIETLLNTYYDDVTLDTAAFNTARSLRSNYKAHLLVDTEQRLIKLVDLVSREHGLITFEDNSGEMSIVALNPPSTSTRDLQDSEIVFVKKLPGFKEIFTDLDYIITELDVYYDYVNKKYKGYIESSNLSAQSSLNQAASFATNTTKVNLMLKTVSDLTTADNCATIKMLYHKTPTRIIEVYTTMSTVDIYTGQWITCSSSRISETSGKIYLVMKTNGQAVYPDKKYDRKLKLYEYNLDDWDAVIQEVPDQDINDDYQEVVDTAEDINEVANV